MPSPSTHHLLSDEYMEIYDNMIAKIATTTGTMPPELTTFWPMRGHKFSGDLMVIGRAVNKWHASCTLEMLTNIDERHKIIQAKRRISESSADCPMKWVTQNDGKQTQYNTNRSGFWRVARTTALFGDIPSKDRALWPSYICWSNLYKVAPAIGGNPTGKLKSVQESFSADLITHDSRIFREFILNLPLASNRCREATPKSQGCGSELPSAE